MAGHLSGSLYAPMDKSFSTLAGSYIEEGTPIYLESSNQRNVTFYYRYGFTDLDAPIVMPNDGPVMQKMWREVGG